MSFNIEIQNEDGYPIDPVRLTAAAAAVLTQEAVAPDTALTVVVTDDTDVQRLNRQFRGVDAPTDVLSFPADEPPIEIPGEPPYLGDLMIAYPYSAAMAGREGFDAGDLLALLVVHGTLHLLGYDHDTAEHREAMWAAQRDALLTLGISPDIIPTLEDDDDYDE